MISHPRASEKDPELPLPASPGRFHQATIRELTACFGSGNTIIGEQTSKFTVELLQSAYQPPSCSWEPAGILRGQTVFGFNLLLLSLAKDMLTAKLF